jgi:hypothetical protein
MGRRNLVPAGKNVSLKPDKKFLESCGHFMSALVNEQNSRLFRLFLSLIKAIG